MPLWLGYGTLNIYTQIGLVMLVGLISKHGILMVTFANHIQEHEGLNWIDAMEKAAAVRMRPVLMTTAVSAMRMMAYRPSRNGGPPCRSSARLASEDFVLLFICDQGRLRDNRNAEAATSSETRGCSGLRRHMGF